MKQHLIKKFTLALSLLAFFWLSACNVNVNLTQFSIEYPVDKAVYIGITAPSQNAQDTKQLGDKPLKINFTKTLSGQPKISLNGHDIAAKFDYFSNYATVDASKIKSLLRQGANTLSVDRTSLGPEITFYYDGEGPVLVVESAEVTGAAGNKTLHLQGHLRDYSAVNSAINLKLVQITGYDSNNKVQRLDAGTVSVAVDGDKKFDQDVDLSGLLEADKPLLYHFEACDKYGYCSTNEYLADVDGSTPLPLKNAIMVALGDTLIKSVTPIVSSSLKNTLDAAPIDMRCLKEPGVAHGSAAEGLGLLSTTNLGDYEDGGAKGRKVAVLSGKYKCANWDDTNICGDKRGVINGKNITQKEFDEYKLKNPTADINDAKFNCDGGAASDRYYSASNWNTDGGKLGGMSPFSVAMAGTTYAGYMQRMFFYDGKTIPPDLSGIVPNNAPAGSVTINQFQILKDNKIHINLMMTQMFVQIEMTQGYNGMCGFWEKPFNVEFPAISLFIPKMAFDADIVLDKQTDGTLSIQMDPNSTTVNFVEAPKFKDLTIQCGALNLPLGGLVDGLSGMIKDMIAGIVPGIINQVLADNMKSLRFGGALTQPDLGTSFDALLTIQELGTASYVQSPNIYDLKVALQSAVNTTKPDQTVRQSLGPQFIDDPVNPAEIFNATSGGDANITMAINSNLINSMLSAMHATGVTHLTVYNGKTYYGGNPNTPAVDQADATSPTLSSVKKGDTRLRLWPDMAPTLGFSAVEGKAAGQTRAKIDYQSAILYFDKYDGSQWQNQIQLGVHFNLAVEINDDGQGRFTMGSAGPPEFVVDSFVNKTNIQVPKSFLQGLINMAMEFGGDVLANQFLTLDFNKIVDQNLNGQVVKYYSSEDGYTLTGDQCLEVTGFDQTTGQADITPPADAVAGADGKPDLICYTFSFDVATHTAGTTGANHNNLFFQMKVADSRLPPPYAVPRFDLDGDGVKDYQDNCAVPQKDLDAAIAAVGGVDSLVYQADDPEVENGSAKAGDPKPGAEDALRSALNSAYDTANGAISQADKDYYNALRTGANSGDPAVQNNSWVDVMFRNASQLATWDPDGARGNLCLLDDDKDGIANLSDNCLGVFNPDQADADGAGVGDACNVKRTWVMIRSLGSEADTGDYQCLTHAKYTNTSDGGGTSEGIDYSREMRNNGGSTARTTVACDIADPNQYWYLAEMPNSNDKLSGNPHTDTAAVYQIFADPDRNNTTSWQLVASKAGNGGLKMAKMNAANIYFSSADDYVAGWILDVDTTALSSNDEKIRKQPWMIRSWKTNQLKNACLFYNNDSFGTDINENQCAGSYSSLVNMTGTNTGSRDDTWYRWGIYVQGTEQLWNGDY